MSAKINKYLVKEMQGLDAAGLLRQETAAIATADMELHFSSNKRVLDFTGNDILGWTSNQQVRDVARQALEKYGTGSTSSRFSTGTSAVLKALEAKLATFLGYQDCIVYQSSYLLNMGLFEPITNKIDTIFIDEMCNPALFDAIRMSSANVVTYRHNDYEDLEYHLKCSKRARFRLIVTDAIFHSDGGYAGLRRIEELKNDYDAITIVDDSLGIGVLGENGKGTANHLQVSSMPTLLTGSFAYALGNVNGGFICGDADLLTWIRHTSRSYLLAEPLSPVNASVVLEVIRILQEDPVPMDSLNTNVEYIKSRMNEEKWRVKRTDHPFVSLNVGSTLNAQKMVEHLYDKNILATGLCYPTTPEGAALLRTTISASHTKDQIDRLIMAIKSAPELLK